MLKCVPQLVYSLLVGVISASACAEPLSNGYEISFAPGLGYSTYSGLLFSGAIGAAVPLIARIQLSGRTLFEGSTSGNVSKNSFQVGPVYNFNDEFSHSGFLGGGVGYQTNFPDSNDPSSAYGYFCGGSRWLISERHKITYSPNAELIIGRESKSSLQIEFLNFSLFF